MKPISDININNQRVLIRVDFNVPLNNGTILSTKRIDETLPTLNYILEQNPKQLIILSHLGRPKGKYVKDLSLQIILPYLKDRLNQYNEFLKENNCQHKIDIPKIIFTCYLDAFKITLLHANITTNIKSNSYYTSTKSKFQYTVNINR